MAAAVGCGDVDASRRDGSAVRVAVGQAPETLDPRFATSATAMRLAQLSAPPLCVVGDDGRPRLQLATSITAIDDLTVEAKLDGTRRFPSGARVRADDVVFTFQSTADPAVGAPQRTRLKDLAHVDAIDDDTVRFTLARPAAPFVVDVVCALGVLSRAACAGAPRCTVGAGARVVDVDVDRWRFERADAPALDVRVLRDGTARLLAVAAGDVDVVAGDVAPWDAERLPPGVVALAVPGLGFSYLGVNTRRCDDRCRRGIAAAVDVDAIVAGRVRGRAQRASGLLPPGHWAKDPTLAPPAHDDAAARAWLAPTADVAADVAGAAGAPRRLRLLVTPDRLRKSVAVAMREQLAVVGVDVEVVVRDWSALYEDLKAGRFDLVLAKWTPVAEPDLLTTVFHSRSIPTATTPGGNRGAFVDVDVDAWLDAARVTGDERTRAALYGQVERRVAERMALVPLWFDDELWLAGPRITGLSLWRTGSLLPLLDVRLAPPTQAAAP